MLTSRRDYLLRIIDEVGRLLTRVIFQREKGRELDALQSVMQACERLFALDAEQLFQFTPDQHFAMLADGEAPADARNKILLYAALNVEAARAYLALDNQPMARLTFINALRFTLKARQTYGRENLPPFTPSIPDLLAALKDTPLDAETAELINAQPA
jgi:hypothetical protein